MNEKWGRARRSERSFIVFREFIRDNQLVDLVFEGKPWTWCNNCQQEGKFKERIDRIFSSREWEREFGKAKCTHIHNEASDHCIMHLEQNQGEKNVKGEILL